MEALIPRLRSEVAPGAVHVPGWLSAQQQGELVAACREWAKPPAGMRATRMPTGGMMSVQTVCLGWHWLPYRYSRTAEDVDGAPVKPFPSWLGDLGRQAVADAYGDLDAARRYQPDVALVNFYDDAARMGMHADKDERSLAPVVSLSLGTACVFRFGNASSRNRPWTDVRLESGDLFVFGGPARLAYHGVPKTIPGTADPGIGLAAGRLNITLRQSGLTRPARPARARLDSASAGGILTGCLRVTRSGEPPASCTTRWPGGFSPAATSASRATRRPA